MNSRLSFGLAVCWALASAARADDLRPIPLKSEVREVQPMTGIVLWTTNAAARTAPIQLEFNYLPYADVIKGKDEYDWGVVDRLLEEVASRKHQAILRFYDTYVGKPSGVPGYIRKRPDYRGVDALSEKEKTGFSDWSHPELQRAVAEFFRRFAERYDRDPRLAFLEVGFGLWSEYHIYDGPMTLGGTFPSFDYQREFARDMTAAFHQTPWMISVDAAQEQAPFAGDPKLLALPFGLFDDSFNHAKHAEVNEPNWVALGLDRWKIAPTGGEFSFYEPKDQSQALAPKGPHGVSFEDHAAKFHLTFILGDAQPRHQNPDRIRAASLACGYRFRVVEFRGSGSRSVATIENRGIAPIYHDAYPAVGGVRSGVSLKGLLPGESRAFPIEAAGGELTIESDRLVPGQRIEFDADLR